jgi:hypothetical protein
MRELLAGFFGLPRHVRLLWMLAALIAVNVVIRAA